MKKLFLRWTACLLLTIVAASCSRRADTPALLEQIPADADIVALVNMKTLAQSLGGEVEGSKITLPPYWNSADLLDEKAEQFLDLVSNSGVDAEYVAMAGNFKDRAPMVAFSLLDADSFRRTLTDQGYTRSEGSGDVTYYVNASGSSYVALRGDYAYYYAEGDNLQKAKQHYEDFFAAVKQAPASDSPLASFLTQGNAGGACIRQADLYTGSLKSIGAPAEIVDIFRDASIVMSLNVDNNTATLRSQLVDAKGKTVDLSPLSQYGDLSARVSRSVLNRLPQGESLVYTLALKQINWDVCMNFFTEAFRGNAMAATILKTYLEKIDGTIALGLGVNNGLESLFKINRGIGGMEQLSITLLVETQDGKAQGILTDLKGFLVQAHISTTPIDNGFTFVPEPELGTLYVQAEGNVLSLSNVPLTGTGSNLTADRIPFTKSNGGLGIAFDRDNRLMKDLGIDRDVTFSMLGNSDAAETTTTLSLSGTENSGVLEKLCRIVLDIRNHQDRFEEMYRQSNQDDYDYDYDYDDDAYSY
jgi:hypothetical protein